MGQIVKSLGDAPFSVRFKFREVAAMIGFTHPALVAMMRSRLVDLVTHHRLTVGKNVSKRFPGGRSAQKWFFASFKRWGARNPLKLGDVQAESFGAHPATNLLTNLEHGRAVRTGAPMAVPTYASTLRGAERVRAYKRFNLLLRERRLGLNPATGALLDPEAGEVDPATGRRTPRILGYLRRRRYQRPLLGFSRAVDEVLPRHVAKLDSDLELALTAAGREALVERDRAGLAARDAAVDARISALRQGRSPADAKRVYRNVLREMRKTRIAALQGSRRLGVVV